MGVVTRTIKKIALSRKGKQLKALDRYSKSNLNELQNYSTILGEAYKRGPKAQAKLYKETGMESTMNILRKKKGAKL